MAELHETWATNDFVTKTLETCARSLSAEMAYRLSCARVTALNRQGLESPLEAAFLAAWEMYELFSTNGCTGKRFYLENQVPVGAYRLDFRIKVYASEATRRSFPDLCIELDGHEFHERTKEQVAKRNERDRYLLAHGWRVIRYSGAEVYRDPLQCVADAWSIADDAMGEIMLAEWRAEEGAR